MKLLREIVLALATLHLRFHAPIYGGECSGRGRRGLSLLQRRHGSSFDPCPPC